MCGIAGFSGDDLRGLIPAMSQSMRHRGPDDKGEFHHPDGVSMAMRRLSIRDLEGGHQPMQSADGQTTLVFNGEIFNSAELRSEYESRGFSFGTEDSDTEVVLASYVVDGEDGIKKLNGMFAFVIHDARKKILFGGRDRFGIKPLHYSMAPGRFAFASEIKSLLLVPWVPNQLDAQSLSDFLSFGYVSEPQRTAYARIHRLPAATAFRYDYELHSIKFREYWAPQFPVEISEESEGSNEEVRQALQSATRRWLQSDVEVGFSLSGGLDSTSLLGLAGSGQRFKTYSLGFEEEWADDERLIAREVSKHFGSDHRELVLSGTDVAQGLPAMVSSLDEPYAGGLPSWFIFQAMSAEVKVAVTGTGGDELFGNYGKALAYRASSSQVRRLARNLRTSGSVSDVKSPFAFLYPLAIRQSLKKKLLSRDFLDQVEPAERILRNHHSSNRSLPIEQSIARFDLGHQLPNEFLMMTDRFSMAHSIEARTPFLDGDFFSLVSRMPMPRSRDPKHLLRSAVDGVVPRVVLDAPKRGFVLPLTRWLRGPLQPLVTDLLSPSSLNQFSVLAPEGVSLLWKRFADGRDDLTQIVWTLFMLQFWLQHAGNKPSTPQQ